MKTNKLLLLLASLMLSTATLAQESALKQINQIKRDTTYLYAEATMESAQEALEEAGKLLMQQVQEYVETQRKLNKANSVLAQNVSANCESLSMMRGTMHHMLVYVKKSDLEGVSNATAINEADKTDKEVVKQSLPPIPTTAPAAEPEPASAPILHKWQTRVIRDLMACDDTEAVKTKLIRLKSRRKISNYGNPSDCPSIDGIFWIVLDNKGGVCTILSPGTFQRISYRDMTTVTLQQFKGQSAFWFNFQK